MRAILGSYLYCLAAVGLAASGCRTGAPAEPPSPSVVHPGPAASSDATANPDAAGRPAASPSAKATSPARSPALEQCEAIDDDACGEPDPDECACTRSCFKACVTCAKRCKASCVTCASSCDPEHWECGSACTTQLLGCPASCIEPQATCMLDCVTGGKCP